MNRKWSYVPFSQIIDWQEKSKIKSGNGKTSGKYKMFVCSDTEVKRYDASLLDNESLIFGTGGKASIHYFNGKFAYSTDCVVACKKIDSNVDLKFYYYYFRQNRLQPLQKDFTGSGLQHTSKKKIGANIVPIPSFEEQHRIVSRIEELFSELDKAVETLQIIKKQLAVYRQAVLKEAFNGTLTKHWRKLKNITQSWKTVSINEIIQKNKYSLKAGPFGSSLKKDMYSPTGYKIYGQEQVISGNENMGEYYVDEKNIKN